MTSLGERMCPGEQEGIFLGHGRTRRSSRRRGVIRFWDFPLSGAPPLLSVSLAALETVVDREQMDEFYAVRESPQ